MKEVPVPSRQIHLDFHTSEHLPNVGGRFSKAQFQEALKLGRINAINLFAKGHHSWSYYPTKVGREHPTLQCDLLGQQIEACHEIGVRAPIYYTVGWSSNDAEDHPEWCVRNREGDFTMSGGPTHGEPDAPRPNFSWKRLCPTGEYLDLMIAQTIEICERFDVDGFWYDILNGPLCWCERCTAGMKAEGIDLDDLDAVEGYAAGIWQNFHELTTAEIVKRHPEATIYYNGTTHYYQEGRGFRWEYAPWDANTQQELEDLPTTWGGYDKFALRSKFFRGTGKKILAMSGKFHTAWGEFGGFKHPDAIRYEAAAMVAFSAACNFGDQLHPEGEMDLGTYANVGEAFKYVEKIEEYGVHAQPVASLGLWLSGIEADDEGTSQMLQELQIDFDVVQSGSDLSAYDAIVLPGSKCLSADDAKALNAFAAGGGGVLVTGESALDAEGKELVVDVGASYVGPANFVDDYTVVGDVLGEDLVASPFTNYAAALRVKPDADAEVLATIREPYFDRTWAKYCSHQNTPNQIDPAEHPAVVRKDNVVFAAHRLGAMYFDHGARVHRQLFANALGLVHTKPMLTTEMPSAARVSLLHQPDKSRYVAHLLYGPAMQRGRCLIIEDLVPLCDIPVSIRVPEGVKKATLIPDGTELPMEIADGVATVTVPKMQCHCAVVFEY